MIVEQQVAEGDADEVHGEDVNATGVGTEGVVSATDDVVPTINKEPSILSPTPPTPPPQPSQDIPLTSKASRADPMKTTAANSENFTPSTSSPLSVLDSSAIKDLTCNPPRSFANSASASNILPL
nr:hypothetical protein [Tanacetum cinerariifolium]